MNRHLRLTVLLCAAMLIALSGFSQSKSPLQGVWKVSEVTTTGQNASVNKAPQPGLIIFTGKYYTIVTINTDKPRPNLPQETSKATAAQLLDVWGPFTAQAGTYEVKGSEVTYRPSVAKNPNVMAPGNFMTDTFKIEGNTLTLVSNANRGAKEGVPEEDIGVGLRMRSGNPATIKLTRVE